MENDFVKNFKGLSCLSACKCCCFENLLAAKQSTGVRWGTLTYGCCLCRYDFCFVLILLLLVSCFKLAFLRKTIIGRKLLNTSLKLLLMLNICQCLFIISFIFGSTGVYIARNGIESLSLGLK